MQYSDYENNHHQDRIYYTRLELINKHKFNINSSGQFYSYYMSAYLGINLIQYN